MNKKMRKLLREGNVQKAGIVRGDVIIVTIPQQSKANDRRMRKLSGILYGNTKFTDEQIVYFYEKHNGNASAAARDLRITSTQYRQRLVFLGLKPKGKPGGNSNKQYSDKIIRSAMKKTKNNACAASELIGCSYQTLLSRIKKLGIKPKGPGGGPIRKI